MVFRNVVEADPDDARARTAAAVSAARAGDGAYAEGVIDWLGEREGPWDRGWNTLRQASIAAALGDAERAVRCGATNFPRLHADTDFRAIWEHPAFKAYLKPRG